MKYTAKGESQVTNTRNRIGWGKVDCYIYHETLTKSCTLSYKGSGSSLSISLYYTLKDVLTVDTPLKFNTFVE